MAKYNFKVGENHPQYNHTIYTFYKLINDKIVEEVCTQYKLRIKYNLKQSHLSDVSTGKAVHIKGWCTSKENALKFKPHINGKVTLYNRDYPDGITDFKPNFCKRFNLSQGCLSEVVLGKRPHHKGFAITLANALEVKTRRY